MIQLVDSGLVHLHCQKTGGTFVISALRELGLATRDLGGCHLGLAYARELLGQDVQCFTFVRHPLSWFQSYWCDRQRQSDWGGNLVIGREEYANNLFNKFVLKCVSTLPGYVSDYFEKYTGTVGDSLPSWVGTQERLVDDLVDILTHANHSFDEDQLRNLPRVNTSRKHKSSTTYLPEIKAKVIASEQRSIRRFYNGM